MKKLADGSADQQTGKNGSRAGASPSKSLIVGGPGDKSQKAEDKKSSKKKSAKKLAEQNIEKGGPQLKKPLSAYMLYNNHRRPVLRGEYPCKCPFI